LCHCEHYRAFQGRTEREIMLASSQLRRLQRRPGIVFQASAKKLAAFLTSLETQEALLTQRLRDRETKKVLAVIEGKRNPSTDASDPNSVEIIGDPAGSENFSATIDHRRPALPKAPELYLDY
jgi:putative transposase